MAEKLKRSHEFIATGIAGLLLVIVCWILNWTLDGLRTHWLFFPQWLGYCLTVDALVRWRKGSSLISRNLRGYLFLFILSAPVWWLFEGLNLVTQNWSYLGREHFTDLEYFLFATLSFSTVIPAVFSTAELLETFSWAKSLKLPRGWKLRPSDLWTLHYTGWAMLLLLLLFPRLFFPFMWLSLFFIVDPINALFGRRSLVGGLRSGEVGPIVVYELAPLICGFFWELWNFYAFPKWIYSIPYLDYFHIFEMPLAGYGGYIPFGWELFALYVLVGGKSR